MNNVVGQKDISILTDNLMDIVVSNLKASVPREYINDHTIMDNISSEIEEELYSFIEILEQSYDSVLNRKEKEAKGHTETTVENLQKDLCKAQKTIILLKELIRAQYSVIEDCNKEGEE